MTGSEVGEREGGGIGKGPQIRIRTQDARNAKALYVGTLPTRLSAPTSFLPFNMTTVMALNVS